MSGRSQLLQPNCTRMLRRAVRAHEQGEFAKAERRYTALLDYHPDNFDALHGLGRLHYQHGRLDTALALVQSALKSDLGRADGFSSLGLVFHALRRLADALASYDQGLRLEPDNAELLNRRGVALLELGRPGEALECLERVLMQTPDHFEALGNRGNALMKLNRVADALGSYDRALKLAPGNAQLLTNRAVALRRLDRPHEAVMSARSALVSNPDFAQARFVESVARLTLGDFGAWRDYESRWSVGLLASQRRNFTAPLWLGQESLSGKTILLHAEQGSGDTIQFVRYAPLLAARGAKVLLEVQAELVRLLAPMPGVAAVIARGNALPPFDCHCPLLSLPLAFATDLTTISADIPYIAPSNEDVAVWRKLLPQRRPLIGLVWSGGRWHDNDLNRSLRFESLLPLIGLSNAAFVSLQHDVRDDDAAALNAHPDVLQLGRKFRDFADTAAAIASLDAVISADTAVAHLAGAMGKPLFLLLPFAADFRWLRERQDSPWYPTARLYRQPAFVDWDSVIDTLRQDLTRAELLPAARRLSA
jgi:tetratricopeptide (TPR) repeat protein